MPYTLAHPGFLLPFEKRWPQVFALSGVMAGSIVPDLDILFRLTHPRFHIFHFTCIEILLVLWPAAIFLGILFDKILFPFYLKKNRPIHFPSVLFTSLVAIYTHLALDALVHQDAYQRSLQVFNWLSCSPTEHCYLFQISQVMMQYLPQLIITGIGFALLYFPNKAGFGTFFKTFSDPAFKKIFAVLAVCCFSLKYVLSTLEGAYFIDYLMLSGTASLLFAFTVAPLYFIVRKKAIVDF